VTPDFTVIVPAYDAARTLHATLASLDRQTDRSFEAVIVDDGSSDDTLAVAKRLAAGRQWQVVHQENRGLPAARNAALRVARGRWIALLDSDDWYLPNHLETMRRLLTSADDVGLAFADAWAWDERRRRFLRRSVSRPYRPHPLPTQQWEFFRALAETNFVFVAAAVPREVLEGVGGFEESLRAAEDWNMWLRLVAAGHRAVGSEEHVAVYRHAPGQMSKDPVRMFTGRLDALRHVRAATDLPPDVGTMLDVRIARAERELAAAVAGAGTRALRSRAIDPIRPLRDFRLRAPQGVLDALPELRRGGTT
jgi:hypothetical protein